MTDASPGALSKMYDAALIAEHLETGKDAPGYARRSALRAMQAALAAATPTAEAGLREKIARIVEPFAGWDKPEQGWMKGRRDTALAKADDILKALVDDGGKGAG